MASTLSQSSQSDSSSSEEDAVAPSKAQRTAESPGDSIHCSGKTPVPPPQGSHHQEIIANHYNSRGDGGHKERKESKIFHMRNFNNWVKSCLINRCVNEVRNKLRHGEPIRALDMCCGKGGDLIKWRAAGIKQLVCTDIAKVSIEQCRQRYENMGGFKNFKYAIEYHDLDSTVVRQRTHYQDPTISFHVVSCQFAFHYCFETLRQAECMLRNASECLAPGGFFFGTIPNADEIMRRRQLCDEDEFGNEVYRISFECNAQARPLFGAKYNFYLDGVVNCPEFLVHFGTLEKLARKFGLRLIERKPFPDFFREQTQNRREQGLLERMNALKTYRLNDRQQAETEDGIDPANYQLAKEYLEANPSVRQVGTLSKCEWETIGLYQVFIFEKVKGEYNKEGKMEYKF